MSMSARAQSTGSQSGRGAPLGKPAGVGIYFQESGSDIVVNHLIRGGSAERSGKVVAGDIIVSIDNNDVRSNGVGQMRNFIVGPEGSTVNLTFVRNEESFTVALLRGSPEYITSVMGPQVSTSKSPMVSAAMTPEPQKLAPVQQPSFDEPEPEPVAVKKTAAKVQRAAAIRKEPAQQAPTQAPVMKAEENDDVPAAAWNEAVPFSLALAVDFNSIGDHEVFKKDVAKDVATAANIDPKHIKVTGLRAGSVIVDMLIAQEAGDALSIVQGLQEQIKSPNSPLMQGKLTSKAKPAATMVERGNDAEAALRQENEQLKVMLEKVNKAAAGFTSSQDAMRNELAMLRQENEQLKRMPPLPQVHKPASTSSEQLEAELRQLQAAADPLIRENEDLKKRLSLAESGAGQATWVVEQMAEKQAQASNAASAEIHKFQEALEQAQFDNVAYRRAAQELEVALKAEQEESKRLAAALAKGGNKGADGAAAERARMQQQIAAMEEALKQAELGAASKVSSAKERAEMQEQLVALERAVDASVKEQAALKKQMDKSLEDARKEGFEAAQAEFKQTLWQEGNKAGDGGGGGDVMRLQQLLEQRNAELARLREESKTTVAQLQQAMSKAAEGPVNLDAEFRDTGRAAIIALPHVITHLQSVLNNQDNIRALAPVTTVMLHALEPSRQRCASCIPQAVPQLVSLLVSRQPTTVREAAFALSLTSMSPEGRVAILSMPQSLAHLETLLSSGDVQTRRHGAMSLGNLAMDPAGRKGMLEVFTVVEDLTQLLSTDDLDCRRSACLAIGNLVIEEGARDTFLGIAMSVRALSEQLKSRDRFLVRYATGAIRNVAVDGKGRRAVLAQQDTVAALKGLLASPDQTTARFAGSALRNLSLTPFESSMGPSDPKGKPYQGSSRVQMPERTTATFLGLPVPFADEDGLGIPMTMTQSKAQAQGAISL